MAEETHRPDQITGAPHPRETAQIYGHARAEAAFLHAFSSGRLHHGWLLTGPRGIGKATLAWRIARFLRATPITQDDGLFGAPPPPKTLDVDPNHPIHALIDADAEPGIRLVTRTENQQGRIRAEIVAENIRALAGFFGLSLTDGGRRVVIVDAADEMNPTAANALLKMLEEPPAATTLLLISHQPSRLLPTIRSRCRTLRMQPLNADDLNAALLQTGAEPGNAAAALAQLAEGSVGDALRLLNHDGVALYADIVSVLGSLPRLDRPAAMALADSVSGRGAEARFGLLIDLLDIALARLVRGGATGQPAPEAAPGEAGILSQLAPDAAHARRWAEIAAETGARLRHGRAVNLDPGTLVLDTLIKLNDLARQAAA